MISFRYHLVSLVAVLLALGIGIVLGSGFLGGVVLQRVRADVRRVAGNNEDLRAQNAEQERTLTTYEQFAEESEAELIGGTLATREVVILTMDGTDPATLAGLGDAVEVAGGNVASTIRATQRLSLESPEDRADLAAILEASTERANELRRELGIALGDAVSAAASGRPASRRQGPRSAHELENLLRTLVDADFVEVERPLERPVVPRLALFLVVEGGTTPPPLRPLTYTRPLAANLARRNGAVVVAEPATSVWSVVGRLRANEAVSAQVSTVDHADTVPGRIAAVLGLRRAALGRVGHYGIGPGAEDVVPQPASLAG